jgi:radical SAM protein
MSIYDHDAGPVAPGAGPPAGVYDRAPFIVIWEVTRACDLVCRHCRAEAEPDPAADELTTAEGRDLLARLRAGFGPIVVVLTGGDPLKRADLCELAAYGHGLGLRMAVTPSATALLTRDALARLATSGVGKLALSLDGADAATHDAFRGVPGTFDRTIRALAQARELGMQTQVNTSVGPHNENQLETIAQWCRDLGVSLWSVFQMVPTGRASRDLVLTAGHHERIYRWLAGLALDPATTFDIKTTAGQPFQRVLLQERIRRIKGGEACRPAASGRAPAAVNDGKGFLFVSRSGDIFPSGFLPVTLGNVREDDIVVVYRQHPTLLRLRDAQGFSGKCGACNFNDLCGGSRSRAYALNGDPFSSDPTCVYHPPVSGIVDHGNAPGDHPPG